jgi:diguanylate cyclase (GGDEF)-like protein
LTIKIKEFLCNIDELPVLPGIAVKILEKIGDSDTSLHQLAEILAADPTLSAKVLSVVNSPFFGLKNKITNLPHAVSLLGEESLKYMALSFSFLKIFKGNNKFDYSSFWRESLTCAVISRLISRAVGRSDAEDIYFLGLIHNIGILALVQSHPEQYAIVIKRVEEDNIDYHIAENEIFGCNHMDIGTFLIDTWGLPKIFSLPILNHHYPENISMEHGKELICAKIIHLSCQICRFLHAEDRALNLTMVNQLISDYEMTRQVDLVSIVKEACNHIEPLLELFNVTKYDNLDYIQILEDGKKEMYRLSFEMIKKIKKQQKMIDNLSVLASHDGLTNLKNYKSFKEALGRELALSRRYGYAIVLALADLDNFKSLNDRLGHMAGDHVLREISRFFTDHIRKSDIVARYGGEEFAFILTRTSLEKGFRIIDRLRSDLAGLQIEYQNEKISITMSVGITSFSPNDQHTDIELLRHADSAMYRAKRSGRNKTFIFDSGH